MYNSDLSGGDSNLYEVNVDLCVLHPLMLYGISRKLHETKVATTLNNSIGHLSIFSFDTGSGNDSLAFGGSGNNIVS